MIYIWTHRSIDKMNEDEISLAKKPTRLREKLKKVSLLNVWM